MLLTGTAAAAVVWSAIGKTLGWLPETSKRHSHQLARECQASVSFSHEWSVKTDLTERPEVGASTTQLQHGEHDWQFSGQLASVRSERGGYVGFVRATMPVNVPSGTGGVAFSTGDRSTPSIVFTLIVDVDQEWLAAHKPGAGPGFTITYQTEFAVNEPHTVAIPWSALRANCRGRYLPSCPSLVDNLDKIKSIGFAVLRSRQALPTTVGALTSFALHISPARWDWTL